MANFHRVGKIKSKAFLHEANIDPEKDPRDLRSDEIVGGEESLEGFHRSNHPDDLVGHHQHFTGAGQAA